MSESAVTLASLEPFSSNVHIFRNLHMINVSDDVMSSARDRYLRLQEVTILASAGFAACDEVTPHIGKPQVNFRTPRATAFLKYGRAMQIADEPFYKDSIASDVLPLVAADRLRLLAAFRILTELPNRVPMQQRRAFSTLQENATAMVLDLYPNAAIIHGRMPQTCVLRMDRLAIIYKL